MRVRSEWELGAITYLGLEGKLFVIEVFLNKNDQEKSLFNQYIR